MYLLGHIAIGYLVAWAVARWRKEKLSLWLAFTVGIVPDYDILFQGLGLVHHTYTHSLLLWTPVVIALVALNRKTLPYVAGILSHLLIGDFLVSSIPLLLPLSNISVGLRLGMPSMADALLESSSLLLMFLVMWRNGDLRRTLSGERVNLLMAVPLVSMFSLTWLAARTPELEQLVTYGFSKIEIETISVGQILLGILFLTSIAITCIKETGLTKRRRNAPARTKQESNTTSINPIQTRRLPIFREPNHTRANTKTEAKVQSAPNHQLALILLARADKNHFRPI
jgi:hypothetical protein